MGPDDSGVGMSVCIITLNEEENLPRCLNSVEGVATQIVIVDSLSTDRTEEIAQEAGAEFHKQEFQGHVLQKQTALEKASEDWVLCLDADEWLDEDLKEAVSRIVSGEEGDSADGYEVNRRVSYLGSWIDHSGWSPQWRLRLIRRGKGHWAGTDPHDRLEAEGTTKRLKGRLCHQPYKSLSDHLGKVNRYTDIMVAEWREKGEGASLFRLLTRPPARFLRMYLLRLGFLDGWRGLVLAVMGSFYVFLKYAKRFAVGR